MRFIKVVQIIYEESMYQMKNCNGIYFVYLKQSVGSKAIKENLVPVCTSNRDVLKLPRSKLNLDKFLAIPIFV